MTFCNEAGPSIGWTPEESAAFDEVIKIFKETEMVFGIACGPYTDAIINGEPCVTDWYEADQLPVRSGVYETTMTGDGRFCMFRYFDGVNWYEGGGTPNDALRQFQITGKRAEDVLRWRGLTERAT